jgi:uncharacterized protein DUF4349
METTFEFLGQLDRDLRGAAARERLTMEGTERPSAGGGSAAVPFGRRRGASPAPRRQKRWAMLSAASLAVLILAGSIGFVATGGSPFGGRSSAVIGGAGSAPQQTGTEAARGGGGSFFDLGDGADAAPAVPVLPQVDQAASDSSQRYGLRPDGGRNLSKIVRDGRIGLVVNDDTFAQARATINAIALENDGFVLSSSTQGRRGTFVLRVPDRRFILTLAALGEIGTVEFEDQTGQDVTAEFVDLVAREDILQARKRVLLGFLREATTVTETLSLYGRVEDTQLQLERIQGELRFLRDQVSESTIRVQIRERAIKAETEPDVDQPSLGVAWKRALQGFLNVVAAVVIGLGYLVPVAVIALVVWLVVRLARRRSTAG